MAYPNFLPRQNARSQSTWEGHISKGMWVSQEIAGYEHFVYLAPEHQNPSQMFILIFLISLVALIVGLIRPSLFSKIFGSGSRKRVGLILGLTTFVLFIIAVATTPTPPQQEATADQNPPAVEQAVEAPQATAPTPQPQSIEDRIKAVAKDTGGTDISFRDIKDQKADPDRPAGSRMTTVSLNLGDFLTASSLYRDTGEVTSKIFREAFTDPNVYDVIVWYYGDTTDRYGQKDNDIVLSQAIDKPTFLKIVWDNFDDSKLCDFLKAEGLRNGGEATCVTRVNIK